MQGFSGKIPEPKARMIFPENRFSGLTLLVDKNTKLYLPMNRKRQGDFPSSLFFFYINKAQLLTVLFLSDQVPLNNKTI
jgi:hypothetical protein